MVLDGIVVVVSPLIALMQDQVAGLQAKAIPADYLSSTRTEADRKHILADISSQTPKTRLLFVTPELVDTEGFMGRLKSLQVKGTLKLIAVDEAHCISEWGHDFRPAYRKLSQLRHSLPGIPIMALTATAAPQVQQDIIKSLKLHNAEVLITSFNRPNTHYSVDLIDVLQQQSPALLSMGAAPAAEPMTTFDTAYACLLELLKGMYLHEGMQGVISTANKKGHVAPQLLQQKLNDTQQHLKQQDQQQQQPPSSSIMSQPCAAAIVYVLKRQTVDAIASKLRADGICAMAYHAGLSASARTTALEQWRDGVVPIVVATVAFGMGVDKSNVRLVVHFNLPRTLEGFYQESGRAGRDGQPSRSVLFYTLEDRRRMDFILEKDAQRKNSRKHKRQRTSTSTTQHPNSSTNSSCPHALEAFGKVVHYCTAAHCRRSILLGHFGEVLTSNASCNRQQQHSRDTKAPMLYGHTLLLAPESAAGVAHNTSMVDHGPYRTTEHPHDVQPCCDFCDAAACVAAAVSSLREIEAASVIQRSSKHSWGNYGLCSARQKAADGDLLSFERGDDGTDTGEGSSSSSIDDDDLAPDELAAVSAADSARHGASSRQVADDTAYLDAMLAAEHAYDKRQQQQQGGIGAKGSEDPLFKRANSQKQVSAPAASTAQQRSQKLADLMVANTRLGCSQQEAMAVAASLEAVIFAGSVDVSSKCRAQLMEVVKAIRSASSWLGLPKTHDLSQEGLAVVLTHAVKDLIAAASNQQMLSSAVTQLQILAQVPVTAQLLERTGIAKSIKQLRKHDNADVGTAAAATIEAWRKRLMSE
eukprot:jgi/Chrzof1/8787/Cz03g24160.t1